MFDFFVYFFDVEIGQISTCHHDNDCGETNCDKPKTLLENKTLQEDALKMPLFIIWPF